MQLATRDRVNQQREALDQLRRTGAARGGVFRETQLVDAVGVEARAGAAAMEPARFDLCQMNEQRGERSIRRADQAARALEQLTVRQMRKAALTTRNELHDRRLSLGATVPTPRYPRKFRARRCGCAALDAVDMGCKSSCSRTRVWKGERTPHG